MPLNRSRLGFVARLVVGDPTISSVAPSSGSEGGGTAIVVSGTQFELGTTVTVGGNAGTSISVPTRLSLSCVTPAGTGTDDVIVTTSHGAVTSVGAFAYVGSPALWTPVFFSDNRVGGTGRTSGALRDGTKWTLTGGTDAQGTQVIAAPVGAPAELSGINVLELTSNSVGAFARLSVTSLGTLADGNRRNFRGYMRFDQVTAANENHPIQDGSGGIGTRAWGFYTYLSDLAGNRSFAFRPHDGGANSHWYPEGISFTAGEWVRIEWQIVRAGIDYSMRAWVFNSNGTLRYGPSDFTNNDQTTQMPNYTFGFDGSDGVNSTQVLQWGSEGLDGTTTSGVAYMCQAACAVVDGIPAGEFIGPYGSCTGEDG